MMPTKRKAHLSVFWESNEKNAPAQAGKNNRESPQLHAQLLSRQGGATHFGDFRRESIHETVPVPL